MCLPMWLSATWRVNVCTKIVLFFSLHFGEGAATFFFSSAVCMSELHGGGPTNAHKHWRTHQTPATTSLLFTSGYLIS